MTTARVRDEDLPARAVARPLGETAGRDWRSDAHAKKARLGRRAHRHTRRRDRKEIDIVISLRRRIGIRRRTVSLGGARQVRRAMLPPARAESSPGKEKVNHGNQE